VKPVRWKRIEPTYLACIQPLGGLSVGGRTRFWSVAGKDGRLSGAFAGGVR
jgi:hypothetical protein